MVASESEQIEVSEERRVSQRSGSDLKVRFCVISGETGRKTKKIPGTVKNLSESGFCLSTDLTMVGDLHVLASGSGVSKNSLELTIELSDESQIQVNGTACWYNLSEPTESHRYQVGVQVDHISKEDLVLLRNFLRANRKQKIQSLLRIKWLSRLFGG